MRDFLQTIETLCKKILLQCGDWFRIIFFQHQYINGEYKLCYVQYKQWEIEYKRFIDKSRFKDISEIDESLYEVESFKKKIIMDVPIQIGFMILQYAKLRMLSFYYDCLDKYIDRSDFELIQMDTDSLYFAISQPTFRDVIKPDMIEEYDTCLNSCGDISKSDWFPRICYF